MTLEDVFEKIFGLYWKRVLIVRDDQNHTVVKWERSFGRIELKIGRAFYDMPEDLQHTTANLILDYIQVDSTVDPNDRETVRRFLERWKSEHLAVV